MPIRIYPIKSTNYFTAMVTKILKIAGIVLVLLNLYGCPFFAECPPPSEFEIPDLVTIEPIDSVYHVGDEIIYTAIIPSHIDTLNIDIYEDTRATSTLIIGSEIYRFDGNYIEVNNGLIRRLGDGNTLTAFVTYNPTVKAYEFRARIIFTQPREYKIYTSKMFIDFRSKNSKCVLYGIETNIRGFQIHSGEIWEFRVVP